MLAVSSARTAQLCNQLGKAHDLLVHSEVKSSLLYFRVLFGVSIILHVSGVSCLLVPEWSIHNQKGPSFGSTPRPASTCGGGPVGGAIAHSFSPSKSKFLIGENTKALRL